MKVATAERFVDADTQAGSFILDEARTIVYGDRQAQYGHPAVNFDNVAKAWSSVLGTTVTVGQVGLMMIQLKVLRAMNQLNHSAGKPVLEDVQDSFVDIAGYAEVTMRALFEEPPR
jgi:hypothetical protein